MKLHSAKIQKKLLAVAIILAKTAKRIDVKNVGMVTVWKVIVINIRGNFQNPKIKI